MISTAWAQDAATGAAAGGDLNAMIMSALPFVLVFAIFYFVLLRPQLQAGKDHKAMIEGLKKGDVVVTDGGVIGEIVDIKANMTQLKVADGVVLSFAREAVKSLVPAEAAKEFTGKAAKADAVVKKR